MADPASKKDFQEVISNLKTFQDVASEKRRKQDQIKYNEDQKRLMEIGKELKEANATDTLKLEAEKDKIKQERSIEKLKQESGKRAVEIQKSGIELQKKAIEATGGVASDNKEYREEEKRIKLAELAERKRTATSPAAKKEIAKEERELLGNYFERFLGKDSRLASGLTSIGEGLKAKVKGGLEGIFSAIKAGAFALFLASVAAFLRSDLFKDMKDKYLPVIVDGIQSLYDTLKGIVDGFFPDGEFSAAAGFKNIFDELSTAFTNFSTNLKESFLDENGDLTLKSAIAGIPDAFGVLLGAFINPVTGLLAILAPRKFFGAAVWVGKKLFGGALRLARGGFGKLFKSIGLFSDELGTSASNMDGQVSKSKKTGVFRRGLRGVTGIFKGLFTRVGRFGGLLLGIRQTMNTDLDKFSKTGKDVSNRFTGFDKPIRGVETQLGNTQRTMQADLDKSKKTGVFRKGLQGTGGKFKRLFRVLGKFGGLLGGVGLTMLSFLDPSSLGKVFTTVGDSFKSLFSVVGDFAKSIGNVASKATAKVTSVVADALKTVKNIGKKPITTADADARRAFRRASGQSDYQRRLKASKTGTSPKVQSTSPSLDGTGPDDISPKVSSAVDAPAGKPPPPKLTTFDTTSPKIPMMDLKSSKIVKPKIIKPKMSLKKAFAASTALLGAKMIPFFGIGVGFTAAAARAWAGDTYGAGAEFLGAFAPSVTGLPIDAALVARDMYQAQYGIFPEEETDTNLMKGRMVKIGAYVKEEIKNLGKRKKPKIGASPPALTAEKRAELIQKRSVFNYAATDLPSFAEYERSAPLLRVNPSFDRNGDGVYDEKEFRRAKDATRKSRGNESVLDSKGGAMFLSQTINAPSQKQVFKIDKTIVGDAYADKVQGQR